MSTDIHFSARLSLLFALVCIVGMPRGRCLAQQAPDRTFIRRGEMGPRDRSRVERFVVDSQRPGWAITLETRDPRLVDLDLFVFGPDGPGGPRLCASEGIERVETCRIGRAPSGVLIVEIVASDGKERSEYELTIRPVYGVRISATPLAAEDAKPLAPGEWTSSMLASSSRSGFPPWALYDVSADRLANAREWIVAVASGDPGVDLGMALYDRAGRQIARSEASGPYQDLRVASPSERLFVLVTSKQARPPVPTVEIGVFRADAPIPVGNQRDNPKGVEQEWIASGREGRAYALGLAEGATAIVELEGTAGQLSVSSPAGAVVVKRIFGSAQQLAWIGDPLGQSRHVLTGLNTARSLVITVDAPKETPYRQVAGWTLHLHARRMQPNYVVQFGMDEVERWDEWWTGSSTKRAAVVPPGGLKVLELAPPPDVRRGAPTQQSIGPSPWDQRVVSLARLVGESALPFDLAICTRDGRVLDIEGAAVRWEWPADPGPLYLAVFTDPFRSTPTSGPFEIELTRSLIAGK